MKILLLCLMLGMSWGAAAEDLDAMCVYSAGVASRIQDIRHQEGSDWDEFKSTIETIYADDDGRDNILGIGYWVYTKVLFTTSSDDVFERMYSECDKFFARPSL